MTGSTISLYAQTGQEEFQSFYYEPIKIPENVKSLTIKTFALEDKFGEVVKKEQLQSIDYKETGFYLWTVNDMKENKKKVYNFLFDPISHPFVSAINEISIYSGSTLIGKSKFNVVATNKGLTTKESEYKEDGSLKQYKFWYLKETDKGALHQIVYQIDCFKPEGGETGETHKYTYNSSENITECISENVYYIVNEYKYNLQNDVYSLTIKTPIDLTQGTFNVYKKYIYEYVYDTKNNWTKKTTYEVNSNGNKKPVAVSERQLTY